MNIFFEQNGPAVSITGFLDKAAYSECSDCLGFELEHFIVTQETGQPVGYLSEDTKDEACVEQIMLTLASSYEQSIYERGSDGKDHLFGLTRGYTALSLEPGAQLEISIGPLRRLREIEQEYHRFRSELDPVIEALGLKLALVGYHPTAQAHNIPLIPKLRYQFMDQHFASTGRHGICMMRATASTQVSVDYLDQDDAIQKLRVATALGPLLAFLTDNSPVFESAQIGALGASLPTDRTVDSATDEITGAATVTNNARVTSLNRSIDKTNSELVTPSGLALPNRMARMACWDDTDPDRSLVPPGLFDDDFDFYHYAQGLLRAPAIFTPAGQTATAAAAQMLDSEKPLEYTGFRSFNELLSSEALDDAAILHILSMFFYDARFKSYVEIRQADALPFEYALAYTALIKGVFYNPAAVEYYSTRFTFMDATQVAFAKTALRKSGYDALVYRRAVHEWLDELLEFARAGLPKGELEYLAPLAQLIETRRTVLDLHYEKCPFAPHAR
ncbi:MAG: hypothetical protein LBC35_06360 [Coriobacteriales bacterium]|jgi:glutamate--cysteine ligase|nr:hypothetical protein [Coriobacteriales bacterium]